MALLLLLSRELLQSLPVLPDLAYVVSAPLCTLFHLLEMGTVRMVRWHHQLNGHEFEVIVKKLLVYPCDSLQHQTATSITILSFLQS